MPQAGRTIMVGNATRPVGSTSNTSQKYVIVTSRPPSTPSPVSYFFLRIVIFL